MKTLFQMAAIVSLVLFGGCVPTERFQWSHEGRRAAVIRNFQLALSNERGEILQHWDDRDTEAGQLFVNEVEWLSDGERLLVHRLRVIQTWDEAKPVFPEKERAQVEALAAKIPSLLSAAVLLRNDAPTPEALLTNLTAEQGLLVGAAFRLAMEEGREAVIAALSEAPHLLTAVETAHKDGGDGYVLSEIALLHPKDGGDEEWTLLDRGLKGVEFLSVSPEQHVFAVGRPATEKGLLDVEIASLKGGPFHSLLRGISSAIDWSVDGKSIVFLAPVSNKGGEMLSVRRVTLNNEMNVASDEALAFGLVPFAPRVAALPEGGILFASQPLSIPAKSGEPPLKPRLYRISAQGGEPQAIPTKEGALPMDLGAFVLSPDGRSVAIVENGSDAVAVIDLATGESELISEPHDGWKCRTMPAWRTSHELTFAGLDTATGAVRWLAWSRETNQVRDLSESWAAESIRDWLEAPATKNATEATP